MQWFFAEINVIGCIKLYTKSLLKLASGIMAQILNKENGGTYTQLQTTYMTDYFLHRIKALLMNTKWSNGIL